MAAVSLTCKWHRYLNILDGLLTCLLTPPAGEDIAKETAKEWKGLRVTVKLTVQNRVAKVGTAVRMFSVCRSWSAAATLQRGGALHVHHMVYSNRLYTISIQLGSSDRT